MNTSRRSFLSGIIAAAAAPAIIRIPGLIMPIRPALVAEPAQIGRVILTAEEREFVNHMLAAGVMMYASPHPQAGQLMSAVDAYINFARKKELLAKPDEYRQECLAHSDALYERARRESAVTDATRPRLQYDTGAKLFA